MKPSRENTGDMLGLLASRGLFPNGLAQIPKEQNWNDPDTQYMHSEWNPSDRWQNAEDANFPRKVPKNQWNQRWQDAGKRFADYQAQQEQEDDEEW